MAENIDIVTDSKGIYKLLLDINDQNSFGINDFILLAESLERLSREPSLRVLILGSKRGEIFSQGLNLNAISNVSDEQISQFIDLFFKNLQLLYLFPHPVICCMPGHSMGYGCMLALTSDYRYMADKGRIGLPEVKLGIRVPIFIARLLQDLVGIPKADHLILEGGALKAQDAKQIGLVDEIVDANKILEYGEKQAQKFLRNSRSAISISKLAMRHRMDLDTILKIDFEETLRALQSPDAVEGIRATIENRRPKFNS